MNQDQQKERKLRKIKRMNQSKYFILDVGGRMTKLAEQTFNILKEEGNHVFIYITDAPNTMCLEEVTEDEFLDHCKANK